MMRKSLAMVAWVVAGCGSVSVSLDAGSDGSGDSGSLTDSDVGYTQCTGPYGAKLCGGPAMCNVGCPEGRCSGDQTFPLADPTRLRICTVFGRVAGVASHRCFQCTDGNVCWGPEFGVLLSMNGHADWVRYPDRSTYTGDPLPEPATCPQIPGLPLCGGACGACADGYVCIGRSPLHPYSVCVNKWKPSLPCKRGDSCIGAVPPSRCLTFKVDSASQSVADANSLCVESAICDAAAKSYPGGAYCGP
jgi:hypothetical protein